jgi:hypothetical protein
MEIHNICPIVAEHGARAIHLLSDNIENRILLSAFGACEVVVNALERHMIYETVTYQCCNAIGSLAFNNNVNAERLGAVGACVLIVTAMVIILLYNRLYNRICILIY